MPIVTLQTPAPVAAPADLSTLQNQLADLNVQLAGYQAQLQAVQREMRNRHVDPATRAEITRKAADITGKVAQTEGDIAQRRMQIAIRQGVPVSQIATNGQIIIPPPYNPPPRQSGPDPDGMAVGTFVFLILIGFPLSVAWAKRILRGTPHPIAPRQDDESAQRLARLEQGMDAIAIEIERISEGQRFVTKILAERPATPVAAKALGAGPMEPIPVLDKQAVREQSSVTPH